jgi:outer membrane protein with beta-barrel domain
MMTRPFPARTLAPAGFVRPGSLFLSALALAASLSSVASPALASGKKGEVGVVVYFGAGNYDNTQFNEDLIRIGYPPIESGIEYGFGVDYRFSQWISFQAGAARIGGESSEAPGIDPTVSPSYGVHGTPLMLNLIGHVYRNPRGNVDLFAGGGPLLNATVSASSGVEASKTGTYFQAGGTIEYRFSPMVALSMTGLARKARADGVDARTISGDPTAIWDVTFNGSAFWFGPKLYFGATE